VKSLAEAYIGRHAKLKKGTWADDEAYLARHLLLRFGSKLALAITTDDMATLHAEIGSKHPYAANRLLEIVRKMYNLGRKWGLVPIDKANPASGVERFPETKRRRFVTPDELPQLSKAIDQEFDEYRGQRRSRGLYFASKRIGSGARCIAVRNPSSKQVGYNRPRAAELSWAITRTMPLNPVSRRTVNPREPNDSTIHSVD
jgi:hypothetical protein